MQTTTSTPRRAAATSASVMSELSISSFSTYRERDAPSINPIRLSKAVVGDQTRSAPEAGVIAAPS
jgi:hypothetical protein